MRDEIKKILAKTFSIEEGLVDDQIAYGTYENWDSIHHLNLMVELESYYGLQFEPEDIQIMLNIDSIIDCIAKKKKS